METVKVKADNEQGFVIINACDFDKETQSIFGIEDKPKSTRKVKAK